MIFAKVVQINHCLFFHIMWKRPFFCILFFLLLFGLYSILFIASSHFNGTSFHQSDKLLDRWKIRYDYVLVHPSSFFSPSFMDNHEEASLHVIPSM